jgi:hypothetical protein
LGVLPDPASRSLARLGFGQVERFRPATVAGAQQRAPSGGGVLVDNTLVRLRQGLACAVGAGLVLPTPIGRVELNWVAPVRPTRDAAADAMASGRWQALYARPNVGRFQMHFNPTLG